MRAKSFGSPTPQGVQPMLLEVNDQKFKVRGAMSGVRLLNLVRAMDGTGDTDSASEMLKFIETALLVEDRERGMHYLTDSDPPVTLTTLTEIITWLIEEYSGKPTPQSTSSAPGSETTGSGSTATHVSTESISQVPTSTLTASSQSSSPSFAVVS